VSETTKAERVRMLTALSRLGGRIKVDQVTAAEQPVVQDLVGKGLAKPVEGDGARWIVLSAAGIQRALDVRDWLKEQVVRRTLTDLGKGQVFVGLGPDAKPYVVTTPASEHPRGWVFVTDLSADRAELNSDGSLMCEGFFAFSVPVAVDCLPF
jgi:hypothetical protein